VEGNPFVPARQFPGGQVVDWNDISPRFGVAYNLFGDGKTAVKFTLGKYPQGQSIQLAQANNPIALSVLTATRTFTDRNGDFAPDCDFNNTAANGECGPLSNVNFGKNNTNATTFDPKMLKGWGVRGYEWESSLSMQHELFPGVSVDAGYFRRRRETSPTRRATLRLRPDTSTTLRRRRPTTRHIASPFRPTPACRAAAATRSVASTTSARPSSARSALRDLCREFPRRDVQDL
jgi:hypothetical protein